MNKHGPFDARSGRPVADAPGLDGEGSGAGGEGSGADGATPPSTMWFPMHALGDLESGALAESDPVFSGTMAAFEQILEPSFLQAHPGMGMFFSHYSPQMLEETTYVGAPVWCRGRVVATFCLHYHHVPLGSIPEAERKRHAEAAAQIGAVLEELT